MIGEQHFRLDSLGSLYQLFCGHRIGLVTGQEGDVDILDSRHLGNVLRVACDIDSQSVDGQDIAIVAPLGMELRATLRRIICRNGLHRKALGNLQLVAIGHHLTRTVHVGTALIGDETRCRAREQLDGLLVKVVAMLMGDEEIIGLRHSGIVDYLVTQFRHGINLNLLPVILNTDTGMNEGMELDGLPALGRKLIYLVCVGSRLLAAGSCQPEHRQQESKNLLHHYAVIISIFRQS